MKYPINEYFHSIQGEATFTGTPAFFIRFQGCDVKCEFCDTKYSWGFNSSEKHEGIGAQKANASCWNSISLQDLIRLSHPCKHIVITGGEPCLHDLNHIAAEFHRQGDTVQVETSGTAVVNVHPKTWVTVSPKINNPAGKPIITQAVERADEFKFPIATWEDVYEADRFVKEFELYGSRGKIWLQPISEDKKAVEVCYQASMERGWRISAQVHKYLNLR